MTAKRCHVTISREALTQLLNIPEPGVVRCVIWNFTSDTATFFLDGVGPEVSEGCVSPSIDYVIPMNNQPIVLEIET